MDNPSMQHILSFCLELTVNLGLIQLGLVMVLLEASKILASSSRSVLRARFASTSSGQREKLVILGSGWGGYQLAGYVYYPV
jgi:hypothetical protein